MGLTSAVITAILTMVCHYEDDLMPRPRYRATHRDRLLQLLREEGSNCARLAEQLGISTRTLARLLDDLRAEGHRIVSVGEGRTWRYTLLKNTEEDPR